jgi:hypothetical protein
MDPSASVAQFRAFLDLLASDPRARRRVIICGAVVVLFLAAIVTTRSSRASHYSVGDQEFAELALRCSAQIGVRATTTSVCRHLEASNGKQYLCAPVGTGAVRSLQLMPLPVRMHAGDARVWLTFAPEDRHASVYLTDDAAACARQLLQA